MKIRDVLKRKGPDVHAIDAAQPTSDAIARFSRSKVRCLVVTESDVPVGMLTLRDILLHLDRTGHEGVRAPVREAMTKGFFSVAPDSTTEEAHALLSQKEIHHLPVLDGGALVGLVTRVDLLSNEVRDAEDVNEHMLRYIAEGC